MMNKEYRLQKKISEILDGEDLIDTVTTLAQMLGFSLIQLEVNRKDRKELYNAIEQTIKNVNEQKKLIKTH